MNLLNLLTTKLHTQSTLASRAQLFPIYLDNQSKSNQQRREDDVQRHNNMHRLRPHHRPIIQRRYLSGGGFQGPTSRGMGRDGGGRGTGGKHREPRGGSASAGRGSGGGRGDGAGGDGG